MKEFERLNRHFERMANRPDLMWLGRNTNHISTHPAVREAMLDSIRSEEYHIYAPPYGLQELRQLVVDELGLNELSAIITDGAVSGLYHTCHTFLKPGDGLITTDPTWEWTVKFATSIGATVKKLNIYGTEFDYRLNPVRLDATIESNTRCIYLIDPNNPLGTSFTESEIRDICDIARAQKSYLIQDCTYRDFSHDHHLAAHYYPEGTITMWSFSKWLGVAGLRVGAIIANAELIERLSFAPPNILGSNVVAQRGAIEGLKHKSEWFPQVLETTRANQLMVFNQVDQISGITVPVYPSDGNFLILEFSNSGETPESICRLMDERNIMVRQGSYHSKRFGDRFIKVSLSVPKEWVDKFCYCLPEVVNQARSLKLEGAEFLG